MSGMLFYILVMAQSAGDYDLQWGEDVMAMPGLSACATRAEVLNKHSNKHYWCEANFMDEVDTAQELLDKYHDASIFMNIVVN